MMGFGVGMIGLILIGLGMLMFLIALPRGGEAASFLRGSDTLQSLYVLALMFLTGAGIIITAVAIFR